MTKWYGNGNGEESNDDNVNGINGVIETNSNNGNGQRENMTNIVGMVSHQWRNVMAK